MSEKIQVMRSISDWTKNYGWKVYFNQVNSDNYPVFHANTNSKPDLLLTKNEYTILVEAKIGLDHEDMLNGIDQVLKYAGEYYTGRTQYKTNRQKRINAILLATKYSHGGYLYANESSLQYLTYSFLTEHYNMIEKPITHSLTRFLWRQWEKGIAFDYYEMLRRGEAAKHVSPPQKPFVGILVAKTLASTRQIPDMPYLYVNSNIFISMESDKISYFEEY